MSRLFLSHSSANNPEAVAIRDWLAGNGWNDVFLDVDPGGINAGERWERALHDAASRCEVVLFLVSRAWLGSRWCLKEFNLARRLNKRLFGVLIEAIPIRELPDELTAAWQVVQLGAGTDHELFRVTLPVTHEEVHVTFSREGLRRLKNGLTRAGLDPRFFAWPPEDDPDRLPYRGLRPLEAEDAGIFFGRDAPIIEALDMLRRLRERAPPRLLTILGASGAGKSSFLRAGLMPRLGRDDRNFVPLPVIRPDRDVLNGESGLVSAIEKALGAGRHRVRRADVRRAVAGGAPALRPLLHEIIGSRAATDSEAETSAPPPAIVVAIDQAEELFLAGGVKETTAFLTLVRELVVHDQPGVIVIFTIRSDSYDRLELAEPLEGLRQETMPLLPMPRGSYQVVIEGPLARLNEDKQKLTIEPRLTQRLLRDIEGGGGSDALPLLAFTLEQLAVDYGGVGTLRLEDYEAFGGLRGAIEAAVDRALVAADSDASIAHSREARLALLREGLIPRLAGIDPETGLPRRCVALLDDIPIKARPLILLLVEQRLLSTDRVEAGAGTTGHAAITIEPAHEALLRQWSLLRAWLEEERAALMTLEAVRRAARDWELSGHRKDWLNHAGSRLKDAEAIGGRADLGGLTAEGRRYLEQCRRRERTQRLRSVGAAIAALVVAALGYAASADAGVPVPAGTSIQAAFDRFGVSVFRPTHTRREILNVAEVARSTIIARIEHEWVIGAWRYTNRTRTRGRKDAISPWISAVATSSAFRTLAANAPGGKEFLAALDAPFETGSSIEVRGRTLGWPVSDTDYAVAYPALWTVTSLAIALGRHDLVGGKDRSRLEQELHYAQGVADMYRSRDDGGWNIFAEQLDPARHATYPATLAFNAMLELHHSELGWHDDKRRLTAMAAATQRWLVAHFDEQAALPGWRVHLNDTSAEPTGDVSDGLTLQIYSELLRAEEELGLVLPPAIVEAIPRHLDALLGRPHSYADSTGITFMPLVNFDGKRSTGSMTENYLWYPWAIECAARWLHRLDRLHGSAEEKLRARRVVGYLVVDIGSSNLAPGTLAKQPIFKDNEQLYALGTLIAYRDDLGGR
jgi:conflict system STAND superfamily ATPase/TIR domain-containing protein